MSYSIDEGIADAETALETLREIKKRFPEAMTGNLPNGARVWAAPGVNKVATGVHICVDASESRAYFCPYALVGEKWVFESTAGLGIGSDCTSILARLGDANPAAFVALLDLLRA